MVGKDWDRVSLAGVSVHGTRDAFDETVGARGSGHQSPGQDCQDSRHRLQSGQEFARQVESRPENGQGHREPPGTKHPHRIHRQEHHESQTTFKIVKGVLIIKYMYTCNKCLSLNVSQLCWA